MIRNEISDKRLLRINLLDNVAVALQDLTENDTIEFEGLHFTIKENIPAKHKLFLRDLHTDTDVYMYGVLVGKVQHNVKQGELMTVENTKHATAGYSFRDYRYKWIAPDVSLLKSRTFLGYKRSDGRYGTANYWLFIPLVFCENRNLEVIKNALLKELGYSISDKYNRFTRLLMNAYKEGADISKISFSPSMSFKEEKYFRNIDGIKFLNHSGGCGGTRQDANTLASLLAAYSDHPNVAGVTVLSLGCQHLQSGLFMDELKKRNSCPGKPLYFFEQQASANEESMIIEAIRQTFCGLIEANKTERTPAPLSQLTIGVKCGGSDGFSGISANPSVGYTSDLLVALGGKVLLAEFPELAGAEQQLIDRCINKESADKFIYLMKSYDELAHKVGSGFHMNPSPGNIKDGLITDAIKSTGAARKGGTSPVVDVLDYTEPAVKAGLNLVCTPGNDVEATTGQAASGATLILFTTGLGTPTGNPVAPTIKISTNTLLARKMNDIIDIDTGEVITGNRTIEEMGEIILDYCVKVASGEEIPKSVLLGQDDFIPWKRGISL